MQPKDVIQYREHTCCSPATENSIPEHQTTQGKRQINMHGQQTDQAELPYRDFTNRLKMLVSKRPDLITLTLSNIFTMRLIGNKTHGDLAEIAISEFINQYMYDFRSIHVGKDLYRAKSQEEDITIINELTEIGFPVSLKAYGNGPLQLSTDKNNLMFPRLELEGNHIEGRNAINNILNDTPFSQFHNINVLPLIYDEGQQRCNILVFDYQNAIESVTRISKISSGSGRKHPVYRFFDANGGFVFEVRYGGAEANALQRGLWTHTKNALSYFDSVTNGWIDYSHNLVLVQLFSHALVSSKQGHKSALHLIKNNIEELRQAIR